MLVHAQDDRLIHVELGNHQKITVGSSSFLVDFDAVFEDFDSNLKNLDFLESENYPEFARKMLDGYSIVHFCDNRLKSFLCDLSGIKRIYVFFDRGGMILGSDPLRMKEYLHGLDQQIDLKIDSTIAKTFQSRGYCPPGQTFIEGLAKSIPGYIHDSSGTTDIDLARYAIAEDASWEDAFENTISQATENFEQICILFSGGVDSTAILAACTRLPNPVPVTCITLVPPPEYTDMRLKKQMENVSRVAKLFPCEHHTVDMELSPEFFEQYAKWYPFELPGMPFHSAMRLANKMGLENAIFLCGQNADSISNLGEATPLKGLSLRKKAHVLAKRFLLSRYNMDSPGMGSRSAILQTIGFCANKELPRSGTEYWKYFNDPAEPRVPIMPTKPDLGSESLSVPEDCKLSESIFLANARSYNDADTAKSFYASAAIEGVQGFLPFSSIKMTAYGLRRFQSMPLYLQLRSKYDIRKYVSKFVDMSVFDAGYQGDDSQTKAKMEKKKKFFDDATERALSQFREP